VEWKRQDANRPTSTARGYGPEWRKTRTRILNRDPWCKHCEYMPSTEADHILPKSKGGTDEDDNLQGLCKPCHSRKTINEDVPALRRHAPSNEAPPGGGAG